jgi:hypothetical protein
MNDQDQEVEDFVDEQESDDDDDYNNNNQTADDYFESVKKYGLTEVRPSTTQPFIKPPSTFGEYFATEPSQEIPVEPQVNPSRISNQKNKATSSKSGGGLLKGKKRQPKKLTVVTPKKTAPVSNKAIPFGNVIQGAAREGVIQLLQTESIGQELAKKFYEIPEGEYLIHYIGSKQIHPKYGGFQFAFVESRADKTKQKLLIKNPFTHLKDGQRGSYSPPLLIYSKHLPGKKYTSIKIIG